MNCHPPPPARERAAVLVVAIAYLSAWFFRDGTFIYELSQQEGGMWLDEAVRTLQGELIYRDFFDFLTPGVVYINAALLAILGTTTTAVGVMVITIGVVASLVLHAVAAAALPRVWRLVPVAVFVGVTYPSYSPGNHKWPTLILCLTAIAIVARLVSRRRSVLSGIAMGLATSCTQDFGVGGAAGLGASLWLLRRRTGADPVAFAAAYVGTVMTTLGAVAIAAGAGRVWYAIVTFPLVQYPKAEHTLSIGFGSWSGSPLWVTAFGLSTCGLLYAGRGVVRRFWQHDPPVVVATAVTGAFLLVVGGLAHPVEPRLFGARAIPLSIVGVLALHATMARTSWRSWRGAVLLGLAGFVAAYAIAGAVRRQSTSALHFQVHRAGAIWASRPIDELEWIELHTVVGQQVFLFPDKAGLYFLSRTRNATSYPILLDQGFYSDQQVAHAVSEIGARCPAVGVWDRSRLASVVMNRPDWFTLRPLHDALMRDYDVAITFAHGAVGLRRRAPCGAPRP